MTKRKIKTHGIKFVPTTSPSVNRLQEKNKSHSLKKDGNFVWDKRVSAKNFKEISWWLIFSYILRMDLSQFSAINKKEHYL